MRDLPSETGAITNYTFVIETLDGEDSNYPNFPKPSSAPDDTTVLSRITLPQELQRPRTAGIELLPPYIYIHTLLLPYIYIHTLLLPYIYIHYYHHTYTFGIHCLSLLLLSELMYLLCNVEMYINHGMHSMRWSDGILCVRSCLMCGGMNLLLQVY